MKNLSEKFLAELANIKDPVIFLGLCPILKVNIYTEEKDEDGHFVPKTFPVLLDEMMKSYDCAGRPRKRELYKILREANKVAGGGIDGPRTENTETPIQNEEVQ
jgi:hypothetical protein